MGYRKLNEFLSAEEKKEFLHQAKIGKWINHKSTVTGEPCSLYFLPVKYKSFERVSLMKMEPNAVQDWHVDGSRKCVVIYPLTDNYAKGYTRNHDLIESYEGVVLLDVTKDHAVFNNEHTRINLQISFDEPIEKITALLDLGK